MSRDWRGELLLANSKKAEVEAILWAMHLSKALNLESILIESDSKLCIELSPFNITLQKSLGKLRAA